MKDEKENRSDSSFIPHPSSFQVMRGFLVSGSDTGVGKTVFTAALARLWRRQGRLFHVCKPVATGAGGEPGRWLSEDTRILAEASGESDQAAITPWMFPTPAAPPVAARLAGTTLRLEEIAAAVRRRAADGAAVLVEGVGGLLCPLTEHETVADLAGLLRLPLLVVVRRCLGTLNHSLLTVETAQWRGLHVAGVIVSATQPVEGVAAQTNVEELRCRLCVPLLAVLPYSAAPAADLAALAGVDWWQMCQG